MAGSATVLCGRQEITRKVTMGKERPTYLGKGGPRRKRGRAIIRMRNQWTAGQFDAISTA
jgi:hypothetical protein